MLYTTPLVAQLMVRNRGSCCVKNGAKLGFFYQKPTSFVRLFPHSVNLIFTRFLAPNSHCKMQIKT